VLDWAGLQIDHSLFEQEAAVAEPVLGEAMKPFLGVRLAAAGHARDRAIQAILAGRSKPTI